MQVSTDTYLEQIQTGAAGFADLLSSNSADLRIPTCPDWNLRQLTTHVGRAHRWAATIVTGRTAAPISFRDVPNGALPAEPGERGPWLYEGARLLADAVHAAGTEEVWTFFGPSSASFWARRMAHETLVHLTDARLAAGVSTVIDPEIATDAIDEWLILSGPNLGSPDERAGSLPDGTVLHLHVTDPGVDGGEWLITRTGAGVVVEPGHGKGDAALTGPAQSLLLVLMRRMPPSDPSVIVHGDPAVLTGWLDSTPF